MRFMNTSSVQLQCKGILTGTETDWGWISLSSPAPPPWSSSSTVVCSRGRGCRKACVHSDDSGRSQGQGHNAETGRSLGPLCHGAPCNHPLFAYWTRSLRSAKERRYYSLANTKSNAEKKKCFALALHTVYLIADSSCDVAYFHPGRLSNMKAFSIKIPDINIHAWRNKEQMWAWHKQPR